MRSLVFENFSRLTMLSIQIITWQKWTEWPATMDAMAATMESSPWKWRQPPVGDQAKRIRHPNKVYACHFKTK